jgi:heptose I phosphotransferase
MVAEGWQQRLVQAGLDDVRELLRGAPSGRRPRGRWECLTKPGLGGRERWRWELDGEEGLVLYVKRYEHTPIAAQIDRIRRQSPRHSRAWWEYHQAHEMERQCIPAVRAVGVAEEMVGSLEVRSAVIFERVPGDAFDRVWTRIEADEAPITEGLARHDMICRLARFVSAFHQTGTCHRDLYLCHIFVDLDPWGRRPPQFALIDLARMHRPRWRRTRWIIKDLSQLYVSARQIGATRVDRMRFLLHYLGLQRGSPRARWYARRVARKGEGILRRIERRRRRT